MKKTNKLYTPEYEHLDAAKPLSNYPYPQFKRNSYISLNGIWKHKVSKDKNDLSSIDEDILVPYPIESIASKVNKKLNKGEHIIYKKIFKLPSNFLKKNTFLHFLGVDQEFDVIINGYRFKDLVTLNMPIKLDISKYVKDKNELIVIVKDDIDIKYPTGKQSKKPKGIFYTPFSGIYYPVFIESLDDEYINEIKIKTNLNTLNLSINSTSNNFEITIKEKEKIIVHEYINSKEFTYTFENPINWTTENPFLYDLEIKTKTDTISSYFGLREITMKDGFVYLNNKKVFLNGVLDQGYYPEGLVTPSSFETIKKDVLFVKELGFNTIRKHIKVELPHFYYYCDKYGLLVFQDFVNNGKYSFFKDTALPTLGFQTKKDQKMHAYFEQRHNFIKGGEKLISYLTNYVSIAGYTIFNEGWGQFDSNNVYHHFKNKYPSILFDATSGWYRVSDSDFNSYHWYFKNLEKLKTIDEPIFLSEFGALCYKVKGHSYGNRNVFGYTYFKDEEELEKQIIDLFENKIIPYKDKLVGTIFTQLSDIEEEDNGLITYDRKYVKFDKNVVKKLLNNLSK